MDVRLALRELTDALLPERCVVCERFGAALHDECLPTLARADGRRCDRCWAPSPASPCATCLAAPPAFEALRAPYRFEGAARRALLEAKFRGVTTLLAPLAHAAAEAVPADWRPTLVVPVPLHRARQRTRGYNQAGIAAEVVARCLGVACREAGLRRTRVTAPRTWSPRSRPRVWSGSVSWSSTTSRRPARRWMPALGRCSTRVRQRCSRSPSPGRTSLAPCA